jgi:hypothetical protein
LFEEEQGREIDEDLRDVERGVQQYGRSRC